MDRISLEEALEKDLATAVDFEITLAALLSASILIFPNTSDLLYYPTIVVALLLLALTLLRQMGIINKLSREQLILDKTSPPLVIATTYAGLYTTLWIGDIVSAELPIQPMTVALVISMLLPPVLVALYEIFYRDFMLLTAITAYNAYVGMDDSSFRNTILGKAKSWLSKSELPIDEQPSPLDQIRAAKPSSLDDVSIGTQIGSRLGVGVAAFAFSAMILLPAFFVIYFVSGPIIHLIKLIVLAVMLALSANFIIILVRFLYARFGRDDFHMNNWRYIRYSMIIYVLFLPQILYEQGHSVDTNSVLGVALVIVLGPIFLRIWRYKRQPQQNQ